MPKLIVSSRGGSGKSAVTTLPAKRMAALVAEAGMPLGEPLSPDGVGGVPDELAGAVGETLGLPAVRS